MAEKKYGIEYNYHDSFCDVQGRFLHEESYATKKEAKAALEANVSGYFIDAAKPEIVEVGKKITKGGTWPGFWVKLRDLTKKEIARLTPQATQEVEEPEDEIISEDELVEVGE